MRILVLSIIFFVILQITKFDIASGTHIEPSETEKILIIKEKWTNIKPHIIDQLIDMNEMLANYRKTFLKEMKPVLFEAINLSLPNCSDHMRNHLNEHLISIFRSKATEEKFNPSIVHDRDALRLTLDWGEDYLQPIIDSNSFCSDEIECDSNRTFVEIESEMTGLTNQLNDMTMKSYNDKWISKQDLDQVKWDSLTSIFLFEVRNEMCNSSMDDDLQRIIWLFPMTFDELLTFKRENPNDLVRALAKSNNSIEKLCKEHELKPTLRRSRQYQICVRFCAKLGMNKHLKHQSRGDRELVSTHIGRMINLLIEHIRHYRTGVCGH